MNAISIRQPWATLIALGHKKIENRTWSTNYRGYILLHASKTFDTKGYDRLITDGYFNKIDLLSLTLEKIAPRGGVVGIAKLVDVLKSGDGEENMFRDMDQYGWVLEDAKPLKFQQCKGKLRLFNLVIG